jgi:hypothetical protein
LFSKDKRSYFPGNRLGIEKFRKQIDVEQQKNSSKIGMNI